MRKGVKATVIGSVFAVMVGGAGYGAFNVVSALDGSDGIGGVSGSTAKKTGPPSSSEVEETTKKFFAAWEGGESVTAASYTNNDAAADLVLESYSGAGHITKVKITPGTATGATVPFTVKATVSYDGKSKPLSYQSQLTVVRGKTTGRALVDWQPTVVHPELKTGDTFVTGESASPAIEAVDRNGTVLTKEKYPSLGPILDELRDKYGDKAGGTPGIELSIKHEAADSADTTLLTLEKGKAGKVRTTLNATAQAAAEKAVTKYSESSIVALQPSTGQVLAIANNRNDGFNAAFLGQLAPGSTMKIISAATLIDTGLTSMNGSAPCPPTATWQSQTFHNLTGLSPDEGASLSDSFARSCNTAFVKFADDVKVDSLTTEAQDRFGLGRDNWKTGIPSFDGSVPASGGPDTAANLIGQGQVQMSPLNMASVTATAKTGTFRQPILVAQSLDGRPLATAKGLSASTSAQLRAMMNRTATSGTAAGIMSGLGGSIGAKTGSAEVDGQSKSNSWFTGYRNDVAAAAMTQDGGHGIDAAGPIVRAVLAAGG
ncbi:penicillin-binding transpeptidase domain-containing protein [Streptomyces prunicolor]|uniref:Penicillin-binding transpeptidase domain-containing protein n=1 Tax=Streptomyces prunicolor TaxID=67348 RepID=A0ABU4F4L3_9ACTN|nr:penicillin-binding transpeptidase domain-containing protein [Streptomyces prunicolor]MDV7214896.1 penicillin-binding transpeptidase domain-containing protein [Streptomyces prunicolor]